jgi:hypothetical protein
MDEDEGQNKINNNGYSSSEGEEDYQPVIVGDDYGMSLKTE